MRRELSTTDLQFGFTCPLAAGMHARPASLLAEVSNTFRSDFVLTNSRNQRQANTKSVLSIIAADIRNGDLCSVQVSGEDDRAAQAALRNFVDEILPTCDVPVAQAPPPSQDGIPRILQKSGVLAYSGVAASPGIARAAVVVVNSGPVLDAISEHTSNDPREELARLQIAMHTVSERIRKKIAEVDAVGNAILKAHLAMAEDVLLAERLGEQISRGKSAGYAVIESVQYFGDLLRQSGSDYLRERAADLQEISFQILEQLHGTQVIKQFQDTALEQPSIVVAERLGPQQLLAFDRHWLKGIVIEQAGTTSHALILARSLGIPVVVDIKNACKILSSASEAIIDGNRGLVIASISPIVERYCERESKIVSQRQALSISQSGAAAITLDGRRLEVAANVSSLEEATVAFQSGADGIGLFRTEMIFLGRKQAPSEDEQFAIYSEIARLANGRAVIIRTFDFGGDKTVDYLNLQQDKNSFLGYRGARIYADHPDLLQTQLRAVLRASVYGTLQIMVPLISSLEEIRAFKKELGNAQRDLEVRSLSFKRDTPIGVMVEVPSVAFILDQLSPELDFFSIGTNDLAQYFLAVEREAPGIGELCNVLYPAFIRFLEYIVDQVHRTGKWIGMCGEMAADIRHLPLLLGLGLHEISVPARNIPELKNAVQHLSTDDCKQLLAQITACREISEIQGLLDSAESVIGKLPLLCEQLILLESDSRTKEEAIQELVDAFYLAGRTHDRRELEQAVWAREDLYSTGLGFGFATPHCKTDAVTANSIGVLRPKSPINWGAADQEPVRMVILIAIREQKAAHNHLQVFSELARKLMNEDFRERLLKMQNAATILQYLAGELSLS